MSAQNRKSMSASANANKGASVGILSLSNANMIANGNNRKSMAAAAASAQQPISSTGMPIGPMSGTGSIQGNDFNINKDKEMNINNQNPHSEKPVTVNLSRSTQAAYSQQPQNRATIVNLNLNDDMAQNQQQQQTQTQQSQNLIHFNANQSLGHGTIAGGFNYRNVTSSENLGNYLTMGPGGDRYDNMIAYQMSGSDSEINPMQLLAQQQQQSQATGATKSFKGQKHSSSPKAHHQNQSIHFQNQHSSSASSRAHSSINMNQAAQQQLQVQQQLSMQSSQNQTQTQTSDVNLPNMSIWNTNTLEGKSGLSDMRAGDGDVTMMAMQQGLDRSTNNVISNVRKSRSAQAIQNQSLSPVSAANRKTQQLMSGLDSGAVTLATAPRMSQQQQSMMLNAFANSQGLTGPSVYQSQMMNMGGGGPGVNQMNMMNQGGSPTNNTMMSMSQMMNQKADQNNMNMNSISSGSPVGNQSNSSNQNQMPPNTKGVAYQQITAATTGAGGVLPSGKKSTILNGGGPPGSNGTLTQGGPGPLSQINANTKVSSLGYGNPLTNDHSHHSSSSQLMKYSQLNQFAVAKSNLFDLLSTHKKNEQSMSQGQGVTGGPLGSKFGRTDSSHNMTSGSGSLTGGGVDKTSSQSFASFTDEDFVNLCGGPQVLQEAIENDDDNVRKHLIEALKRGDRPTAGTLTSVAVSGLHSSNTAGSQHGGRAPLSAAEISRLERYIERKRKIREKRLARKNHQNNSKNNDIQDNDRVKISISQALNETFDLQTGLHLSILNQDKGKKTNANTDAKFGTAYLPMYRILQSHHHHGSNKNNPDYGDDSLFREYREQSQDPLRSWKSSGRNPPYTHMRDRARMISNFQMLKRHTNQKYYQSFGSSAKIESLEQQQDFTELALFHSPSMVKFAEKQRERRRKKAVIEYEKKLAILATCHSRGLDIMDIPLLACNSRGVLSFSHGGGSLPPKLKSYSLGNIKIQNDQNQNFNQDVNHLNQQQMLQEQDSMNLLSSMGIIRRASSLSPSGSDGLEEQQLQHIHNPQQQQQISLAGFISGNHMSRVSTAVGGGIHQFNSLDDSTLPDHINSNNSKNLPMSLNNPPQGNPNFMNNYHQPKSQSQSTRTTMMNQGPGHNSLSPQSIPPFRRSKIRARTAPAILMGISGIQRPVLSKLDASIEDRINLSLYGTLRPDSVQGFQALKKLQGDKTNPLLRKTNQELARSLDFYKSLVRGAPIFSIRENVKQQQVDRAITYLHPQIAYLVGETKQKVHKNQTLGSKSMSPSSKQSSIERMKSSKTVAYDISNRSILGKSKTMKSDGSPSPDKQTPGSKIQSKSPKSKDGTSGAPAIRGSMQVHLNNMAGAIRGKSSDNPANASLFGNHANPSIASQIALQQNTESSMSVITGASQQDSKNQANSMSRNDSNGPELDMDGNLLDSSNWQNDPLKVKHVEKFIGFLLETFETFQQSWKSLVGNVGGSNSMNSSNQEQKDHNEHDPNDPNSQSSSNDSPDGSLSEIYRNSTITRQRFFTYLLSHLRYSGDVATLYQILDQTNRGSVGWEEYKNSFYYFYQDAELSSGGASGQGGQFRDNRDVTKKKIGFCRFSFAGYDDLDEFRINKQKLNQNNKNTRYQDNNVNNLNNMNFNGNNLNNNLNIQTQDLQDGQEFMGSPMGIMSPNMLDHQIPGMAAMLKNFNNGTRPFSPNQMGKRAQYGGPLITFGPGSGNNKSPTSRAGPDSEILRRHAQEQYKKGKLILLHKNENADYDPVPLLIRKNVRTMQLVLQLCQKISPPNTGQALHIYDPISNFQEVIDVDQLEHNGHYIVCGAERLNTKKSPFSQKDWNREFVPEIAPLPSYLENTEKWSRNRLLRIGKIMDFEVNQNENMMNQQNQNLILNQIGNGTINIGKFGIGSDLNHIQKLNTTGNQSDKTEGGFLDRGSDDITGKDGSGPQFTGALHQNAEHCHPHFSKSVIYNQNQVKNHSTFHAHPAIEHTTSMNSNVTMSMNQTLTANTSLQIEKDSLGESEDNVNNDFNNNELSKQNSGQNESDQSDNDDENRNSITNANINYTINSKASSNQIQQDHADNDLNQQLGLMNNVIRTQNSKNKAASDAAVNALRANSKIRIQENQPRGTNVTMKSDSLNQDNYINANIDIINFDFGTSSGDIGSTIPLGTMSTEPGLPLQGTTLNTSYMPNDMSNPQSFQSTDPDNTDISNPNINIPSLGNPNSMKTQIPGGQTQRNSFMVYQQELLYGPQPKIRFGSQNSLDGRPTATALNVTGVPVQAGNSNINPQSGQTQQVNSTGSSISPSKSSSSKKSKRADQSVLGVGTLRDLSRAFLEENSTIITPRIDVTNDSNTTQSQNQSQTQQAVNQGLSGTDIESPTDIDSDACQTKGQDTEIQTKKSNTQNEVVRIYHSLPPLYIDYIITADIENDPIIKPHVSIDFKMIQQYLQQGGDPGALKPHALACIMEEVDQLERLEIMAQKQHYSQSIIFGAQYQDSDTSRSASKDNNKDGKSQQQSSENQIQQGNNTNQNQHNQNRPNMIQHNNSSSSTSSTTQNSKENPGSLSGQGIGTVQITDKKQIDLHLQSMGMKGDFKSGSRLAPMPQMNNYQNMSNQNDNQNGNQSNQLSNQDNQNSNLQNQQKASEMESESMIQQIQSENDNVVTGETVEQQQPEDGQESVQVMSSNASSAGDQDTFNLNFSNNSAGSEILVRSLISQGIQVRASGDASGNANVEGDHNLTQTGTTNTDTEGNQQLTSSDSEYKNSEDLAKVQGMNDPMIDNYYLLQGMKNLEEAERQIQNVPVDGEHNQNNNISQTSQTVTVTSITNTVLSNSSNSNLGPINSNESSNQGPYDVPDDYQVYNDTNLSSSSSPGNSARSALTGVSSAINSATEKLPLIGSVILNTSSSSNHSARSTNYNMVDQDQSDENGEDQVTVPQRTVKTAGTASESENDFCSATSSCAGSSASASSSATSEDHSNLNMKFYQCQRNPVQIKVQDAQSQIKNLLNLNSNTDSVTVSSDENVSACSSAVSNNSSSVSEVGAGVTNTNAFGSVTSSMSNTATNMVNDNAIILANNAEVKSPKSNQTLQSRGASFFSSLLFGNKRLSRRNSQSQTSNANSNSNSPSKQKYLTVVEEEHNQDEEISTCEGSHTRAQAGSKVRHQTGSKYAAESPNNRGNGKSGSIRFVDNNQNSPLSNQNSNERTMSNLTNSNSDGNNPGFNVTVDHYIISDNSQSNDEDQYNYGPGPAASDASTGNFKSPGLGTSDTINGNNNMNMNQYYVNDHDLNDYSQLQVQQGQYQHHHDSDSDHEGQLQYQQNFGMKGPKRNSNMSDDSDLNAYLALNSANQSPTNKGSKQGSGSNVGSPKFAGAIPKKLNKDGQNQSQGVIDNNNNNIMVQVEDNGVPDLKNLGPDNASHLTVQVLKNNTNTNSSGSKTSSPKNQNRKSGGRRSDNKGPSSKLSVASSGLASDNDSDHHIDDVMEEKLLAQENLQRRKSAELIPDELRMLGIVERSPEELKRTFGKKELFGRRKSGILDQVVGILGLQQQDMVNNYKKNSNSRSASDRDQENALNGGGAPGQTINQQNVLNSSTQSKSQSQSDSQNRRGSANVVYKAERRHSGVYISQRKQVEGPGGVDILPDAKGLKKGQSNEEFFSNLPQKGGSKNQNSSSEQQVGNKLGNIYIQNQQENNSNNNERGPVTGYGGPTGSDSDANAINRTDSERLAKINNQSSSDMSNILHQPGGRKSRIKKKRSLPDGGSGQGGILQKTSSMSESRRSQSPKQQRMSITGSIQTIDVDENGNMIIGQQNQQQITQTNSDGTTVTFAIDSGGTGVNTINEESQIAKEKLATGEFKIQEIENTEDMIMSGVDAGILPMKTTQGAGYSLGYQSKLVSRLERQSLRRKSSFEDAKAKLQAEEEYIRSSMGLGQGGGGNPMGSVGLGGMGGFKRKSQPDYKEQPQQQPKQPEEDLNDNFFDDVDANSREASKDQSQGQGQYYQPQNVSEVEVLTPVVSKSMACAASDLRKERMDAIEQQKKLSKEMAQASPTQKEKDDDVDAHNMESSPVPDLDISKMNIDTDNQVPTSEPGPSTSVKKSLSQQNLTITTPSNNSNSANSDGTGSGEPKTNTSNINDNPYMLTPSSPKNVEDSPLNFMKRPDGASVYNGAAQTGASQTLTNAVTGGAAGAGGQVNSPAPRTSTNRSSPIPPVRISQQQQAQNTKQSNLDLVSPSPKNMISPLQQQLNTATQSSPHPAHPHHHELMQQYGNINGINNIQAILQSGAGPGGYGPLLGLLNERRILIDASLVDYKIESPSLLQIINSEDHMRVLGLYQQLGTDSKLRKELLENAIRQTTINALGLSFYAKEVGSAINNTFAYLTGRPDWMISYKPMNDDDESGSSSAISSDQYYEEDDHGPGYGNQNEVSFNIEDDQENNRDSEDRSGSQIQGSQLIDEQSFLAYKRNKSNSITSQRSGSGQSTSAADLQLLASKVSKTSILDSEQKSLLILPGSNITGNVSPPSRVKNPQQVIKTLESTLGPEVISKQEILTFERILSETSMRKRVGWWKESEREEMIWKLREQREQSELFNKDSDDIDKSFLPKFSGQKIGQNEIIDVGMFHKKLSEYYESQAKILLESLEEGKLDKLASKDEDDDVRAPKESMSGNINGTSNSSEGNNSLLNSDPDYRQLKAQSFLRFLSMLDSEDILAAAKRCLFPGNKAEQDLHSLTLLQIQQKDPKTSSIIHPQMNPFYVEKYEHKPNQNLGTNRQQSEDGHDEFTEEDPLYILAHTHPNPEVLDDPNRNKNPLLREARDFLRVYLDFQCFNILDTTNPYKVILPKIFDQLVENTLNTFSKQQYNDLIFEYPITTNPLKHRLSLKTRKPHHYPGLRNIPYVHKGVFDSKFWLVNSLHVIESELESYNLIMPNAQGGVTNGQQQVQSQAQTSTNVNSNTVNFNLNGNTGTSQTQPGDSATTNTNTNLTDQIMTKKGVGYGFQNGKFTGEFTEQDYEIQTAKRKSRTLGKLAVQLGIPGKDQQLPVESTVSGTGMDGITMSMNTMNNTNLNAGGPSGVTNMSSLNNNSNTNINTVTNANSLNNTSNLNAPGAAGAMPSTKSNRNTVTLNVQQKQQLPTGNLAGTSPPSPEPRPLPRKSRLTTTGVDLNDTALGVDPNQTVITMRKSMLLHAGGLGGGQQQQQAQKMKDLFGGGGEKNVNTTTSGVGSSSGQQDGSGGNGYQYSKSGQKGGRGDNDSSDSDNDNNQKSGHGHGNHNRQRKSLTGGNINDGISNNLNGTSTKAQQQSNNGTTVAAAGDQQQTKKEKTKKSVRLGFSNTVADDDDDDSDSEDTDSDSDDTDTATDSAKTTSESAVGNSGSENHSATDETKSKENLKEKDQQHSGSNSPATVGSRTVSNQVGSVPNANNVNMLTEANVTITTLNQNLNINENQNTGVTASMSNFKEEQQRKAQQDKLRKNITAMYRTSVVGANNEQIDDLNDDVNINNNTNNLNVPNGPGGPGPANEDATAARSRRSVVDLMFDLARAESGVQNEQEENFNIDPQSQIQNQNLMLTQSESDVDKQTGPRARSSLINTGISLEAEQAVLARRQSVEKMYNNVIQKRRLSQQDTQLNPNQSGLDAEVDAAMKLERGSDNLNNASNGNTTNVGQGTSKEETDKYHLEFLQNKDLVYKACNILEPALLEKSQRKVRNLLISRYLNQSHYNIAFGSQWDNLPKDFYDKKQRKKMSEMNRLPRLSDARKAISRARVINKEIPGMSPSHRDNNSDVVSNVMSNDIMSRPASALGLKRKLTNVNQFPSSLDEFPEVNIKTNRSQTFTDNLNITELEPDDPEELERQRQEKRLIKMKDEQTAKEEHEKRKQRKENLLYRDLYAREKLMQKFAAENSMKSNYDQTLDDGTTQYEFVDPIAQILNSLNLQNQNQIQNQPTSSSDSLDQLVGANLNNNIKSNRTNQSTGSMLGDPSIRDTILRLSQSQQCSKSAIDQLPTDIDQSKLERMGITPETLRQCMDEEIDQEIPDLDDFLQGKVDRENMNQNTTQTQSQTPESKSNSKSPRSPDFFLSSCLDAHISRGPPRMYEAQQANPFGLHYVLKKRKQDEKSKLEEIVTEQAKKEYEQLVANAPSGPNAPSYGSQQNYIKKKLGQLNKDLGYRSDGFTRISSSGVRGNNYCNTDDSDDDESDNFGQKSGYLNNDPMFNSMLASIDAKSFGKMETRHKKELKALGMIKVDSTKSMKSTGGPNSNVTSRGTSLVKNSNALSRGASLIWKK